MAETLLQKAQRLGIQPAGQPATTTGETLLQKAQRLGIQPAKPPPVLPAAPVQTTGNKVLEGVKAGFRQAGQAGVGALKSIPASANQFSNLGQRALSKLTSWIPGMPKTAPVTPSVIPAISTPTNDDQRAGFLGGQLAQTFAFPERAVTQGAANVANLAKAGKFLQPVLTQSAKALARTATGAGLAKVQGASDKGAALSGGISGGLSVLGSAFSPFLKNSATRSYSQALGATTRENKAISDKVVPELLERKTVAMTRNTLMNKAAARADLADDALEAGYAKLPQNASTSWRPVLEKLSKAKEDVTVNGVVMDVGRFRSLDALEKDLLNVIGGGVKEAKTPIVSVETARKVRQILDRSISQKGKVFGLTGKETDALAVQKLAANSIRSELAKEYPSIDKLNKEFSFWNNVRNVVGDTIQRTKSQTSLAGELATDTGAVVGAAIGGTVGTAVGAGMIGKVLNATVKSTAWRTTSAVTKMQLANFLASGDIAKAVSLLQRISGNRDSK